MQGCPARGALSAEVELLYMVALVRQQVVFPSTLALSSCSSWGMGATAEDEYVWWDLSIYTLHLLLALVLLSLGMPSIHAESRLARVCCNETTHQSVDCIFSVFV